VGILSAREATQTGHAANQHSYSLSATLRELEVRNVTYRRENLGGKWLLQIRRPLGLTVTSRNGAPVASLSEEDFGALMADLLAIIHREHNNQLDSIQIELALVDTLWNESVKHLREADIASGYIIDPKSKVFLAAMQSQLDESALLKGVCQQIASVEKKCEEHAVSMNPLAFRSQHLWKEWGEVKYLSDAGIEKESAWFAIDLKDRK
jgi:hypothetical protein